MLGACNRMVCQPIIVRKVMEFQSLLSERLWNFNFEKKIDRKLLLCVIVSSQNEYFNLLNLRYWRKKDNIVKPNSFTFLDAPTKFSTIVYYVHTYTPKFLHSSASLNTQISILRLMI